MLVWKQKIYTDIGINTLGKYFNTKSSTFERRITGQCGHK